MFVAHSLAFALGAIVLQFVAELPTPECLLAGALAAVVAALLAVRAHAGPVVGSAASGSWLAGSGRGALQVLLTFAIGFAWAGWRASERYSAWLPAQAEDVDLLIDGAVTDLPQPFDGGVRFAFDLEAASRPVLKPGGRILLTWREATRAGALPPDAVRSGERWRFAVRLRRPHASLNPYGFDYEAALLERGVVATGAVRPHAMAPAVRLAPSARGLGAAIDRARSAIRERLRAALPEAPWRGVVIALAIGDQAAIPQAQWRVFNRTGISHLISISGLHVTMLGALAGAAAAFLWRRTPRLALWIPVPKLAAIVGVIAASAYCALAGFGIPAQRTVCMLAVAALGRCLDREPSPARVLSLALVVIVAIDPWAGLTAGYWLSFGAVAMLFHAGSGANPESSLRAWLRAQAVVTIGLAPLTLALFGQVSLVGPIVNAVAIPLVSMVVAPLSLIAAVSPVDWPARLAHALLALGMPMVEWMAALPQAAWSAPAAPPWTIVLASAGAAWLLAPFAVRWRGLSVLLFAPLFLVQPGAVAQGSARLDVLDVGQGLAVVIRTARHTVLFDTGPRLGAAGDAGERVVLPFLRALGRPSLDALVISHADADHAGGARSVLAGLPVDTVWMPAGVELRGRATVTATPGAAADKPPPARQNCMRGAGWTFDGVQFSFLHPSPGLVPRRGRSNRASCVLRVAVAGHAVLLAADIDGQAEASLVRAAAESGEPALAADVLLVPHHGSQGSSSEAFIDAVHPRVAVVSAGYRNRFGHPRARIIERYVSRQIVFLRTDLDGAIGIDLDAQGARARSLRDLHRRYFRNPARLTAGAGAP